MRDKPGSRWTDDAWTAWDIFDGAKLTDPLGWTTPHHIVVDWTADHALTNEQIAAVFGVMAACPQHTFLMLVEPVKRLRAWFAWLDSRRGHWRGATPCDWHVHAVAHYAFEATGWDGDCGPLPEAWPLPHVWLGCSVEDQAAADARLPDLLHTPAVARWICAVPMLGPVDLDAALWKHCAEGFAWPSGEPSGIEFEARRAIHWVIAGCCESETGARPCAVAWVEWVRALRDQLAQAGTPFYLLQARELSDEEMTQAVLEGAAPQNISRAMGAAKAVITAGAGSTRKPGGLIELPYLDGVQHTDVPATAREDAL